MAHKLTHLRVDTNGTEEFLVEFQCENVTIVGDSFERWFQIVFEVLRRISANVQQKL